MGKNPYEPIIQFIQRCTSISKNEAILITFWQKA